MQLDKVKDVPEKALKLLKVLDCKAITAKHLIDTKIGKNLTAVSDQANPERDGEADDPAILEQIKQMKD